MTILHIDEGNVPIGSSHATYPDLQGKTAVVTGGSRGIGAETARALARNGVAVAVVGRDDTALGEVVADIESQGGRCIGLVADCTDPDQVAAMSKQVRTHLGPVGIVMPFAGGNGMPSPTETETLERWQQIVDSELTSTFLTVRAFLPEMVEGGSGVVVTMASAAARQAAQAAAAYAAAKAGVVAFTRHIAGEFAGRGIRANCLAPSAVENDRMRARMTAEQLQKLGASFPLGRIGQPADVAAAALFLASNASSWVTGTTMDVAGGKVMV
ncbi:MAG: short-chain dehydrogenase/reductase [Marmoricola sp.]|nr:short-chain dehydrogenase/reductase [Marmoricola sp.]